MIISNKFKINLKGGYIPKNQKNIKVSSYEENKENIFFSPIINGILFPCNFPISYLKKFQKMPKYIMFTKCPEFLNFIE
jgi:hypothetical protein